MTSNTPRLGLLKKDPVADGNQTFDLKTMVNDNWEKIDEKVVLKAEEEIRQIENIGFGVQTGLNVLASVTPDMNIHVQPGVIYMPDGKRFDYTAVKTITVSAADATNPRKDIVFVAAAGTIQHAAGVPAASPVEPVLPAGAFLLRVVDVPAGNTAIEQAQLIDKRKMMKSLDNLDQEVTTHLADYVKHPGTATTINTGNEYAITLDPAPTAYTNRMGIVITVNADSTGAATLNVNGLGAKAIKKANGNDVTNLKANGIYTVRYNSAVNAGAGAFILQGEGGEYGTAVAADVLSGKTIGTDAGLVSGTMANRGAINITPSAANQAIPAGFHNGSGIVAGDADLIAANILSGKNIFGIDGTLTLFKIQPGTVVLQANDQQKNMSGTNTSPTIAKQINVVVPGIYRVSFGAWGGDSSAKHQIFINGVAKGTLRVPNSTTAIVYTEDIDVPANSSIELRMWSEFGSYCHCNNFRISASGALVSNVVI
ncbi:hypothetical protein [Domibacillus iocasae]|uniref:Uncharacterized protein n=1 Tax=Domibacillus iocasae TaxID=1714016 RepID=A0A1E7DRV0_9BACI|nr:hypothetical protein [Domibacillus iocasae]OES45800.1 hypothetical protein BA724_03065 [Domibacillus iocasae]